MMAILTEDMNLLWIDFREQRHLRRSDLREGRTFWVYYVEKHGAVQALVPCDEVVDRNDLIPMEPVEDSHERKKRDVYDR